MQGCILGQFQQRRVQGFPVMREQRDQGYEKAQEYAACEEIQPRLHKISPIASIQEQQEQGGPIDRGLGARDASRKHDADINRVITEDWIPLEITGRR